jgi:flagellar biosynthesis/type III secretory pathway protein FliH
MGIRPRLNVICDRCRQPRGLIHDCPSNSSRKATFKPVLHFGTCPKCRKPVGNPVTHTCAPKSDFKKRRAKAERERKARERKKRQAERHDYTACGDHECTRPTCKAYREGRATGRDEGFEEGILACPRDHGTA